MKGFLLTRNTAACLTAQIKGIRRRRTLRTVVGKSAPVYLILLLVPLPLSKYRAPYLYILENLVNRISLLRFSEDCATYTRYIDRDYRDFSKDEMKMLNLELYVQVPGSSSSFRPS